MLKITAIVAAVLALMLVYLSLAVIKLRTKNKVGLGSGGHDDLERAIRAQGNFAEYAPIALLLLACLEANGFPPSLVAAFGLTFVVGRLIHIKGINTPPPDFSNRVLGMKITFGVILTLAIVNAGWAIGVLFHLV